MPQLSLYLDQVTMKKVETAAVNDHVSISKWVRKRLNEALQNDWPENYFDLFGSVNDPTFIEPEELDCNNDIKREPL